MSKNLIVGLVKGRHELPVESYIFNNITDVTDVKAINQMAYNFFRRQDEFDSIELYVTGLTVCLVSVINLAILNNWELTLRHFDLSQKEYFVQRVQSDAHAVNLREGGYL